MKTTAGCLLRGLALGMYLFLTTCDVYAHDYLVQSLGSIIKRSSAIIEGTVIGIKTGVDEHNTPVETVTILVNDVIAGKVSEDKISLTVMRLPDEDKNRPIFPHFVLHEKVILHLKKIDGQWFPLGHDQGKFTINAGQIGNSQTTVTEFKSQIEAFALGRVGSIAIPKGARDRDFEAGDHDPGAGISKLGGEFHLLDPARWGPTSGVILLRINPVNARDMNGNALTFQQVRAAVQRAVDSWNNVAHSYATLDVSDQAYDGQRASGDGISTVTFENYLILGGSNGGAVVLPAAGGIINEVDLLFHSDNRWNTDITYPSSYPMYNHPVNGTIGPVDLEDVAAHEGGHGVGLHHVGNNYTLYTMHTTNYGATEWWEKTWRRSLEVGDGAGKIYQDPSFPTSSTQSNAKILLSARSTTSFMGDFIVPSGYYFEIEAGKTLSFAGPSKLRIEGKLVANGVQGSPITFQGNGYPGSWFGIEFYNATAGVQQLGECIIKDASYGLNFINTSFAPSRPTIRDNTYGVNCTNYSDPTFISTVFQTNSWGGHR